jgi:hypothetical protein
MRLRQRHALVRPVNRRKRQVKYVSYGFVALVIAILLRATAQAEEPQQIYTWTGIWRSMALTSLPRLADKFRDPDAKELAQRTIAQVEALHKVWQSNEDEIHEKYLMEATVEAQLLEKASISMSEANAYELLKEISADLDVKLAHCKGHRRRMGSVVRVKIITKSPSGDSGNWQVFHVLAGLKKFANMPGEPLPKLSSPAEGTVTVGRHVIWAKKGDTTTRELTYRIGFSKDDQVIEIPVE